MNNIYKQLRRSIIAVIGLTVLLIGIVAIAIPIIPAIIVIPVGLIILATEFMWAKHLLEKIQKLNPMKKKKIKEKEIK